MVEGMIEASKIKGEIEAFFRGLENKTPISVKEFCYLLPEDWHFTGAEWAGLAVSRGDKIYYFYLVLDVEFSDEEKTIKRIKLRRVELVEVYDLTSDKVYVCTKEHCHEDPNLRANFEIFGLYEEGNICTDYTEWGLEWPLFLFSGVVHGEEVLW